MKKNLDDFKNLELAAPMIMLNVKHIFTPEEMAKESELLAQAVTDKAAEEANKKAALTYLRTTASLLRPLMRLDLTITATQLISKQISLIPTTCPTRMLLNL